MTKRLCCGFRGRIYYTNVNEKKGIMVGQKVDVTESAAIPDSWRNMESRKNDQRFDYKNIIDTIVHY